MAWSQRRVRRGRSQVKLIHPRVLHASIKDGTQSIICQRGETLRTSKFAGTTCLTNADALVDVVETKHASCAKYKRFLIVSTTQQDALKRWYKIGLCALDADEEFQTYEGPRLPVELWQVIIRFATLGTLNIDRVVIATDLWDSDDVWDAEEFSFYGPMTGVSRSQKRTYKIKWDLCLVHSIWHALVLPYLLECIVILHLDTLQPLLDVLNQKPERRWWVKRVEYEKCRGHFGQEADFDSVHGARPLKELLSICPDLRIIGGCPPETWNKDILPHPNLCQLTHIQLTGSSFFELINGPLRLAVRLESLDVQLGLDPTPHICINIPPIELLNLKQLRASAPLFFSTDSHTFFQRFRHFTTPSLLALSLHYHDIIWDDVLHIVEHFGPTLEALDIQTERLMTDPASGTLEQILVSCPKLKKLVLDKPNDWNWTGKAPLHRKIEVLGFSHFTIPGIATFGLLPGMTMMAPPLKDL